MKLLIIRGYLQSAGCERFLAGMTAALDGLRGVEYETRWPNAVGDVSGFDWCWLWCACAPPYGLSVAREVKRQGGRLAILPVWWERQTRARLRGYGDDIAPGYTADVAETLKQADLLTCVTMSEAVQCWHLVPGVPTVKMGAGFDFDALPEAQPAEDYVCTIASIDDNKNQDATAAACERLGLLLKLVGVVHHQYIADRATKHGAELLGSLPHDEAMKVLARARVHALPSFIEIAANANMEACALGVPGALSITGAEAEFFGDGGIYCAPWDAASVDKAIMTAWERPRGQWAELETWDAVALRALEAMGR
jgi:hypothetical protein